MVYVVYWFSEMRVYMYHRRIRSAEARERKALKDLQYLLDEIVEESQKPLPRHDKLDIVHDKYWDRLLPFIYASEGNAF
jgi:hypothetical protein